MATKDPEDGLQDAAVTGYARICTAAGNNQRDLSPEELMDNMVDIAVLCAGQEDQSESFWSLYFVDLNRAMEVQPADTWTSFPIFPVLNDFFLAEPNLRHGRFHKKLMETFEPRVHRYANVMEENISHSVDNNLARERWERHRGGCCTSLDAFWKLDALRNFQIDFNWPEEEFGQYLAARIRNIDKQTIAKIANRTFIAFKQWLQRWSTTTDDVIPSEVVVMINVIASSKERVLQLKADGSEPYWRLDETLQTMLQHMARLIQKKLLAVLESVLGQISRDQATDISRAEDIGHTYVAFERGCVEKLHEIGVDKGWMKRILAEWYTKQMRMINDWLTARCDQSLSPRQFTRVSHIIKKVHSDFELQQIDRNFLDSDPYKSIMKRMQKEEKAPSIYHTHSCRSEYNNANM